MPFDGVDTARVALDILRYAREQIAAGHWVQGTYEDRHGNRCALAWLHRASCADLYDAGGRDMYMAVAALNAAMPSVVRDGPLVHTVIVYNDSHTQRGVVQWFGRAIRALEEAPATSWLFEDRRDPRRSWYSLF